MSHTRRLAAIMFTDIEGYTALMQRSEAEAVKIRHRHREVFKPVTAQFDGQIIQYYGDGTLSIFGSAVSAVKCACELQRLFQQSPKVPVRIGIHVGDIILTEDDIIGDSVNLASRVESMAVAGSVLISDKVVEEIKNQEDLVVKYLGSFLFKNDQKKRDIYALDSPDLVVPESHQLGGKVVSQSKPEKAKVVENPGKNDKKDVFISYAQVDDESLTEEESGWISTFDKALRKRTAQLLGYQPGIWREPKSKDPLPDEVFNDFPKLKVMISIISPRYLESRDCLTELKEFYKIVSQKGGVKIDNKWRIFKVIKTPVPNDQHPPETQGIVGYEFFEVDENGHFREFNLDKGSPSYYQFLERFEDVAQDLTQVIRSLEAGETKTESVLAKEVVPKAVKAVYLAKTTSELNAVRDNIRRDLEMNGFKVLPEQELPLDHRFKEVVQENLGQCQLAIQLVSSKYGLVPEDEEHSVPNLQYELCVEAGLPCLIWMPDDLKTEDPRQQTFLDKLQTEAPNHENTEVLNAELEEFKTHMMDTLDNLEEDVIEVVETDSGPPRVYLIYDKADTEEALVIDDYLYDQGFEVLTPLFDGTEPELRETHKDNLRTCDAALIYHGDGSEFWLNAKINDLRKAPGYGRSKPMAKKAVYISGARNSSKERFRSRELEVIKQFDTFSGDNLRSFNEMLG